jgi:hypothetical protein
LKDAKITAIDRDLQFFQLDFTLENTNMFEVVAVLEDVTSKLYTIKLITTRAITSLQGSTLLFSLTATVIRKEHPLIFIDC